VGGRPDLQEEIHDAGESETGRHGCWKHQEACLEVLPAEDGALPHRTVPALGESTPNSPVLVVPLPHADEGPPLEGVPGVEGSAEDPMEGGMGGDRKREAAMEGSRALRRQEMQ